MVTRAPGRHACPNQRGAPSVFFAGRRPALVEYKGCSQDAPKPQNAVSQGLVLFQLVLNRIRVPSRRREGRPRRDVEGIERELADWGRESENPEGDPNHRGGDIDQDVRDRGDTGEEHVGEEIVAMMGYRRGKAFELVAEFESAQHAPV